MARASPKLRRDLGSPFDATGDANPVAPHPAAGGSNAVASSTRRAGRRVGTVERTGAPPIVLSVRTARRRVGRLADRGTRVGRAGRIWLTAGLVVAIVAAQVPALALARSSVV